MHARIMILLVAAALGVATTSARGGGLDAEGCRRGDDHCDRGHAAAPAVALDPDKAISQLVHDVWGTKQGLPNRQVNAITQTPDGYLWVGTADGLARFDGVRFTVFPSSRYPGIGNDDIRALLVDTAGNLWIGTYGGGLTRWKNGEFTRYTVADGLANDIVYGLSQVRSGALWIGTAGGVSRLENGVFTTWTPEQGLAGERVFSIIEDRRGTLWLATYGGGLSRFRAGKFTTYRVADGLGSDMVLDLHEDDDGAIWIGGYGGGLVRLHDGKFSRFVASSGSVHENPVSLFEDSSGSLWIGTYDGGLSRLQDGRITTYTEEDGLSDDLVRSLFQDREGSLWVGTTGGLDRFRNGKVTHYSTAEGLSHERAYAVYEDAAGVLWIATEGGGLNRFDDGRFTAYTAADGLAGDNVVSLAGDHAGNLWIGTVGQGLSLLRDGRFVNYGAAQGIRGLVYTLAPDAEGGVWVGTSDGLCRLVERQCTAVGEGQAFADQAVRVLHLDGKGDLWIGSNGGGLIRYRNGRFTAYDTEDGLGGDFVYALHEDKQGTLWIGAKDGGLTRFKDGAFFSFSKRGGLVNAAVFQILEDDGALWLSQSNQLLRVDKQQLNAFADGRIDRIQTTSLDEADGIRGSFLGGSQPAGWRSADGRLWFVGDAGVVAVDPGSIPINRLPPPVHIETMLAGDKQIDFQAGIKHAEIVLAPGKGNFEFQYTALSLAAPDQVRFKYRLRGFDTDWVDAGTRRTAYYTNVPPGDYAFQVIASNNDGVWNETGTAFAFHLDRVFYRTWWFYALCAASLLLVVVALHRLRVHHLRARAKALAVTVDERTRELAAANEILQMISTRDPLTGIANRRSFDEKLRQEWQHAIRQGRPLSAVMIDIDDFKAFNDGYGHQQGDECLRQVAGALRDGLTRSNDLVARYGGEEFVALLPDTDSAGAWAVAERLRRAVESLAIPHQFARAHTILTISAGVGTAFPADQSPDDFIAQADRRLYDAKRAGRNRVKWD